MLLCSPLDLNYSSTNVDLQVNFVIDNTNETSFIREEGAQEGFEVRPSPSSQSTGSPSTFDPVQSQEFDDAQLEGDNTAWTNGNQRTAARKEIKRRLPSVSRARDGPSEVGALVFINRLRLKPSHRTESSTRTTWHRTCPLSRSSSSLQQENYFPPNRPVLDSAGPRQVRR